MRNQLQFWYGWKWLPCFGLVEALQVGRNGEGRAKTGLQAKLDFWHLVGLAAAVSGGGGCTTAERTVAAARSGRGTTLRGGKREES